ncbi:ATP-binding protein [Streptomyces sp. TRM64462]|uniref:ATP-binding protein n=1 Tax=Streptomyces sp. TRM64462 TaxID=2741726 RepID=UPI001586D57A|nr:ATP-binding protein [Streptomyces sp. TRM64462]
MPDAKQKYFEPRPESVRLAREFAVTTLNGWGLHGPADDVRLCVSELASNAFTHGSEPGHGFLVRLEAADDIVRLEVHDSRPRSHQQPRVAHPADTDTTGRGLRIVSVLADGWGVEDRRPLGKIVWSLFKTAQHQEEVQPC